jgi:muconolactone delta-isomerase
MKVLALGHDVVAQEDPSFAELRPAEARRAWELYQQDVLREIYFRADRPNGVLVLEVPDLAAARDVIDSLPLVAAGLIDFDLVPLKPYPGFARLFAEGASRGA